MTSAAWIPYCGAAPVPAEWLARWNLDPFVWAGLIVSGVAYFRWVDASPVQRRLFLAALAVAALLFVSPLCALTSALFAARVVHHALLTALVAPLLVAGLAPVLRAPAGGLALWTAGHTLTFWFWHAPPVYAWALSSDAAYWLMQASLLATAVGMWARIRTAPLPMAIAALLAMMVQMGLLGALFTFSGSALYAPHYLTTQAWGFSPLEDQQLAGLIMWAPAAGVYLAAALLLLSRWFGAEERAGFAQ
jgi:putative membrane protein